MNLAVNKTYTSNDKNEYAFHLKKGDVFIVVVTEDKTRCVAMWIDASKINDINLMKFKKDAEAHLGEVLLNCELKLIGEIFAINKCSKVLLDNYFGYTKRVIREKSVDIIFTPAICRVRVEVDENKELAKIGNGKIKVLIVDDSKTIRTILQKIFSTDPSLEVIGSLENPKDVEPFIQNNRPDVITLDIHMPEMDGVTLLKKIYPKFKIPCVMISSISLAEGPLVFDALEHGAVDYIQKPEASEIQALTPVFIEKIKMAAGARTINKVVNKAVKVTTKSAQDSLVVIGSSTGGTEALREILTALPDQIPPILIVQHIPAVFSLAFAKRMNSLCNFEVLEAKHGDEVIPNRVLIAPGGNQMKLVHQGNRTFVEINNDPPVNRFKPSVDYMFESVVKSFYCHTVAVILTGMGKDGAKQMLELKKKGAITIAQNEETSVVFGMPREAIAIGAAMHIEPIQNIAERIISATNSKTIKKAGNL